MAAHRGWQHKERGWQVSAGGQHIEGGQQWHAHTMRGRNVWIRAGDVWKGQNVGGGQNMGGGCKGWWQGHVQGSSGMYRVAGACTGWRETHGSQGRRRGWGLGHVDRGGGWLAAQSTGGGEWSAQLNPEAGPKLSVMAGFGSALAQATAQVQKVQEDLSGVFAIKYGENGT